MNKSQQSKASATWAQDLGRGVVVTLRSAGACERSGRSKNGRCALRRPDRKALKPAGALIGGRP